MIHVKVDATSATKYLTDLQKNQLPFAISRALNWVASDSQKAVRAQLPKRFAIKKNWVNRGILIKVSTKQRQQAEVYSLDDYMARQETGGMKFPLKGKHLAIPVGVAGAKTKRIAKKNYPKALLESGKYNSTRNRNNRVFKIDESTPATKRHGMPFGIYAAHPNQKRRSGGTGLTMLYALEAKGLVTRRFGMEKTVEATVQHRWPIAFEESLWQAIASMK